MSFKPIDLSNKKPKLVLWGLMLGVGVMIVAGLAYWRFGNLFVNRSARWDHYQAWQQNPSTLAEYLLLPGESCDDAPFAFPTTGVIFGSWGQSYRVGNRHQGLDIFAGTDLNVTPVYAVYDGYLTRLADWRSTVIIRIPNDPLQPGRQIWTYYTHMADEQGNSFVSTDFPMGTSEVYVSAGTLLGFQGNYSGDVANPTGLHLHFSIVKDDGQGSFLNETDIRNTLDPTPYFNLPVNFDENPDNFPTCTGQLTDLGWELAPENE